MAVAIPRPFFPLLPSLPLVPSSPSFPSLPSPGLAFSRTSILVISFLMMSVVVLSGRPPGSTG